MKSLQLIKWFWAPLIVVLALILLFPVAAWAEAAWHSSQPVENNAGQDTFLPRVAISGLNAVAVWCQWDGLNYRVYTNYSTDGGAAWHTALKIENNAGYDALHPQVAMSGSRVVAVWQQNDGANDRIYSNYSTTGGASWNDAVPVDLSGYDGSRPQVAISGQNVAVVWGQTQFYSNYRIGSNYSANGGKDWHTAQLIDHAGHAGYLPRVAITGAHVVAVWNQDYGDDERICSNYSSDGGASWHAVSYVSSQGGNNVTGPAIGMHSNNVVVVWDQENGSQNRVLANHSTNGGASWQTDTLIDMPEFGGIATGVAMSGSGVVALWSCHDGHNNRVCSNYSLDQGGAWRTPSFIDIPGYGGYYPQISMSGFNVVAVWKQADGSSDDIYARFSFTGGVTWEGAQLIENDLGYGGSHPQVAVDDSQAVAVWTALEGQGGMVSRIYSNYGRLAVTPPVPGVSLFSLTLLAVLLAGAIFWLLFRRQAKQNPS